MILNLVVGGVFPKLLICWDFPIEPITEKALKIYEDNTNSNYKSYNYIRAHSCHLRTGNSSYTSHGLIKIVQQKIGNTFLVL